jgi:hypothetical protein
VSTPETPSLGAQARGCGKRVKGGIYVEVPTGPFGRPLEDFLIEPPVVVDPSELGLSPIGVKLIQKDGVYHILDWVGTNYYPNVADFVEEARIMGISRRLPKTLDFQKLTAGSRLILLHPRAHDDNWAAIWTRHYETWTCPKEPGKKNGEIVAGSAPCIGFWWRDLAPASVEKNDGAEAVPGAGDDLRRMPAFSYTGWARPDDIPAGHKLAIFGSFPIGNLTVINDPDGGEFDEAYRRAGAANLIVNTEDE